MENKKLKIIPPEGYEIDKENSTFECIKFKPKCLTYEDVAKELFFHKNCYNVDNVNIYSERDCLTYCNPLNATSKKQLEKLLAINKLMNVAKYLNGDWKPDWNNIEEDKFYITISSNNDSIDVSSTRVCKCIEVYFKTKEFVKQAIDILGEDTIRLALSNDW